jgi:hypothetical protein
MHPTPRQRLLFLVLLAVTLCTLLVRNWLGPHRTPVQPPADGALRQQVAAAVNALQAAEARTDETVWSTEMLAEECGQVFESLWDRVNAAPDKLAAAGDFPFGEVLIPRFGAAEQLAHQIESWSPTTAGDPVSHSQWQELLRRLGQSGWQLTQLEFRHNQFEADANGRPRQSGFVFLAHLVNPREETRAALRGNLGVEWSAERTADGLPAVKRVDASQLALVSRRGAAPFRQVLNEVVMPPAGSEFIDPVILADLDGDGKPEIILAARNLVFRLQPEGGYRSEPLCHESPGLIFTGVIADFDGDGVADFLCAKFDGLYLFKGSAQGTFDGPGRQVWRVEPHLKYAQVLTCGDVDGDGSLDVWLGQYKTPFDRGQMPTPYYDANDGYPSYLLLNDGHGNFRDATDAAGLGKKRWRRTYSASFVDLTASGRLDLLVVSDFAGTDLYRNDGHGHFTDVTSRLAEPKGFGMGHAFADFNADGRLDFFVTGMTCPTPQRLDHLGLRRSGHPDYEAMRLRMASGNRLYLGTSGGGWEQTTLGATIARSGWSWGPAAADFDNDGFPDVYIATGHESRQSVADYEPEFWRHDIYVGTSQDNPVAAAYFGGKFGRTRGHGQSYGGYEKNRFFLNQGGLAFVEVAHLMGLAIEQDSRNAVAGDLDADGRVDLVTTTLERWPRFQATLQVFHNELPAVGNWIGFVFRDDPGHVSPIGVVVTVRYAGHSQTGTIVTGDSHRTQSANVVHFGLGSGTAVDSVTIQWPNAGTTQIERPAVNQYHRIVAPPRPAR